MRIHYPFFKSATRSRTQELSHKTNYNSFRISTTITQNGILIPRPSWWNSKSSLQFCCFKLRHQHPSSSQQSKSTMLKIKQLFHQLETCGKANCSRIWAVLLQQHKVLRFMQLLGWSFQRLTKRGLITLKNPSYHPQGSQQHRCRDFTTFETSSNTTTGISCHQIRYYLRWCCCYGSRCIRRSGTTGYSQQEIHSKTWYSWNWCWISHVQKPSTKSSSLANYNRIRWYHYSLQQQRIRRQGCQVTSNLRYGLGHKLGAIECSFRSRWLVMGISWRVFRQREEFHSSKWSRWRNRRIGTCF